VVLFNDTFTNYNEPENGVRPAAVLEAAGVGVQLLPHDCCGRPLISTGQLDQARTLAQKNADALYDAARAREDPVPGAELSVGGARGRAGAAARRGAARAQVVGDACLLFEITSSANGRRAASRFPETGTVDRGAARHCHQKAMGLVPPGAGRCCRASLVHRRRPRFRLLRDGRIVRLFERSLRGIAADRGRRLLPAARALKPGEVLAAAGTSCRHQVEHFAGVHAQHPAVILGSLIE